MLSSLRNKQHAAILFLAFLAVLSHASCRLHVIHSGVQCKGLLKLAGATDADGCRDLCCAEVGCLVWQWCPAGATSCAPSTCWAGSPSDGCATAKADWQGGGRDSAPPVVGPLDPRDFDADFLLPGFHFVPWPFDWM